MLNASKRLFQFLVLAAFLALLAGAPVHAAESGTTLRYAAANFGEESMDPTRTSISASLGLVGPLWDWLTEVDANGKLTPGLALSWQPGADGLSWTFKLRPGVKFHDGSEMTAEDAKFTLMDGFLRPKAKASRVRQFRKGIKEIQVIDRHTVKIVTAKPWPTLPYDLANQPGIEGIVLPKAYIKKVGWDGFAQKPVGTGAWKFVKHEVGNFIEFEAVKNHWRKSPRFDRLRILLVPEVSTRVAMLKTGQVDMARISLDEVPDMAPCWCLRRLHGWPC
jgi:peptide/nickel transport system substrate-binding protein